MAFFVDLSIANPLFILTHGFLAALMLSLLGVAGGIWSEKFDHIAAVTNFLVTPLAFLSGTFYSIDRLHPTFQTLAQPFTYSGYPNQPRTYGLTLRMYFGD